MFRLKFPNATNQTNKPISTTDAADATVTINPFDGRLSPSSSGAGVEPVLAGRSTPRVENGLVAGVRRSFQSAFERGAAFSYPV